MARTAATLTGADGYTIAVSTGKFSNALYFSSSTPAPETADIDFPSTIGLDVGNVQRAGTIEFFFKGKDGSTGANIFIPGSNSTGNGPTINVKTNGDVELQLDSVITLGTTDGFTFEHVAITTSGNDTWKVWYNGVYKGSGTRAGNYRDIKLGKINGNDIYNLYFDELRVSSIQRYTGTGNITVPTAAFTNDSDTLALFHFDTTTQGDDNVEQHNASATISSSFSQSSSAATTLAAQSNLSNSSTLTAAGLLVQVDEYVHVDYWNAEYTEEIPNRFGSATLSATFTQTATATIVKTGSASLTSAATITANGGIRRDGASTLSSAATLSVSAGILQVGASALSAACSVSASAVRTFNASSSLNSAATETAAAAMTFAGAANLLWQGFVLGYPGVQRNASATLSTTTTLSATATKLQFGQATLAAAATVTAQGLNTKTASSNLSSTASMSVSAQIFDITSANFVSNFSMVTVGSVLFGGSSAALVGAFTITANGEVVIEEIPERTIKVKSETRIIDLVQESRIINTKNESRINIVLPQNRTIMVPEESRLVKEP